MGADLPAYPSPPDPQLMDPSGWLASHRPTAVGLAMFCLWVSGSLIARMWLIHRRIPVLKKLCWSVVLLIPLFGWIAYGGCFTPPGESGDRPPTEHDWASGSGD